MNKSNSPRRAEFTVGDAYRADNPMARFVTAIAMASNDVLRLLKWMLEPRDATHESRGVRILSLRLQASALFEASEYLRRCRDTWPEVAGFLEGLPVEAREHLDRLIGATTAGHPGYLAWLKGHRDVTFHYPKLNREAAANDAEEMRAALVKAAGIASSITEPGRPLDLRFDYADEVAVQLLPDPDDDPEHLGQLRDLAISLIMFARDAQAGYLSTLPEGIITVIEQ